MDMHRSRSRILLIFFGIFTAIMLSFCTPSALAQDDGDNEAPRVFIDRLQNDIEKSEEGDPILFTGEVEDDGLPSNDISVFITITANNEDVIVDNKADVEEKDDGEWSWEYEWEFEIPEDVLDEDPAEVEFVITAVASDELLQSDETDEFTVLLGEVREDITKYLEVDDSLTLKFDTHRYDVEVLEVKTRSVTLLIEDEEVEIDKGDTEEVDLDGDGEDDLSVTVDDIDDGEAEIIFQELEGAFVAADEDDGKGDEGTSVWVWIALVVVIAVVVFILIFLFIILPRMKKEPEPEPEKAEREVVQVEKRDRDHAVDDDIGRQSMAILRDEDHPVADNIVVPKGKLPKGYKPQIADPNVPRIPPGKVPLGKPQARCQRTAPCSMMISPPLAPSVPPPRPWTRK